MAIIYPDIDSVGWGDDVNANFRELNQNDTDIKATIGTETIGTTATTLKGAIKEVKGIADNNTIQLNARMKDIFSITRDIQNKKIKIIGDSITAGYGGANYNLDGEYIYGTYKVNSNGHCWANDLKTYLENNFSCTVKNYGITGINSSDIVSNISNLIFADDDIVICMIGTNNRLLNDGITRLKNDLISIYNYVKNLGNEIIFISSIPATTEDENTREHTMLEIDNAIMNVSSSLNLEYISLYKEFTTYIETRDINLSDLLSDSVHPNDIGYDVIEYLILNKLGFASNKSIDNLKQNFIDEITTLNGFQRIGNDPHGIARSGHIVILQLSIKNESLATVGMTICNLDSKYFKNAPNCIGYLYDEAGNKYKIIIFADGRVDLYTELPANTSIWGTLTYII